MELVLTVEDSVICKPDTMVISFNYFAKNDSIEVLKKEFNEFTKKIKDYISNEGLDINKLQLGRLLFKQAYKNVLVEKSAFLSNKSEKTNEQRPDGYSLSCSISYSDDINTKGVSNLYIKLFTILPFVISLNFECNNIEGYKDELLKKLVEKGLRKAKIIAKSSDFCSIKPIKMDSSVGRTYVNFSSYNANDCCLDEACFDSDISDFIDETEKKGSELSDSLTITYLVE